MHRALPLLALLIALGCSRGARAPSTAATPEPVKSPAGEPALSPTETSVPSLLQGTYDEALLWMRSANRFTFVIDEGSVHAEGEMTRTTPGTERVRFRVDDAEWKAEATPQGIAWQKREGTSWRDAPPPAWAPRLYQRVTVVFDPQKKEGVPLLLSTEDGMSHYRFTDANSGELHDVWVRQTDSSIARTRIGETVEMTFQP